MIVFDCVCHDNHWLFVQTPRLQIEFYEEEEEYKGAVESGKKLVYGGASHEPPTDDAIPAPNRYYVQARFWADGEEGDWTIEKDLSLDEAHNLVATLRYLVLRDSPYISPNAPKVFHDGEAAG